MPTVATDIYSADHVEPVYPNEHAVTLAVSLKDGTYLKGTLLGKTTAAGVDEVQTLSITGTPTGGSFTISFTNPYTGVVETTAAIAYNASAAAVQSALLALDAFESGDVVATGGALPGTPVVLTFGGRYADRPVSALSTTDSLTGGSSPESAVAETTAGVPPAGTFGAYATANADGTGVARAILKYACRVVNGAIYVGSQGEARNDAPAFFSGTFRCEELTGLDADALTDLGARLLTGTTSSGVVRLP